MKSPIRTLEEGLKFCEEWIKDPNCSEEQKEIKKVQIADHKKAIKMLKDNEENQGTETALPIQNIKLSLLDSIISIVKGNGSAQERMEEVKSLLFNEA